MVRHQTFSEQFTLGKHKEVGVADRDEKTFVDQVVDRLVTAVAIGEYLPGARLPAERELAVTLRIGRTTVRSALDVLTDRGLIHKRRGRNGGSFVSDEWPRSEIAAVSRWFDERWPELVDACIASTHLHAAIARLAADHRTDHDIAAMTDALTAFRAAGSGVAKQRADSVLHLAIIAAAHNHSLQTILLDHERTLTIAAPAHPWGDPEILPRMEARAEREHGELVDAIVERRADDAGRIAQRHVEIDLELLEHARDLARPRAEDPR